MGEAPSVAHLNASVPEVAAALHSVGIGAAFGVTGSGASWQLITALTDRSVPYYAVAHEAAAAIMAGAFARQSGSLGCSISIKGPGLANMIAGMLSNRYECWPAVSVSEAYAPSDVSPRMHKRLDQRALTAPIVKAFAATTEPSAVQKLAACARAEIPGPVHLDFAGAGTDIITIPVERATDDRGAWDDIRRRIDGARQPVVVVGSLATRSPWAAHLASLPVPVFTTVAAKGVLDEASPFAAGIFTGDGKALAPETRILPNADLVVGLGLRQVEVLTPRPFAASFVGMDTAGDGSAASAYVPCAQLVSAHGDQFASVLQALAAKRSWGADLVAASVDAIRERLTQDEWLPGRVFATLQRLLPGDTKLVTDTGSFCTVAEHVWQPPTWRHFVASANGRFMGTGLPMAIGASLASRAAPIVCAMGDGGIRPFWADIKLAIRERLPIVFVLMSDGRYGSVAAAASAPGLTPDAVDIPDATWFRAVQALGCPASRTTSIDDLAEAAAQWRADDGPCFIEAAFPAGAYAAMTADIR